MTAAVVLFGAGCQSTAKKDSPYFASVEIRDHSLKDIVDTTRAVFVEKGYHSVAPNENLVFEKKGSRMNQLTWGGWLGDDKVAIRVEAEVTSLSETAYRLQCTVKMVHNSGDPFFEEDVRFKHFKPKPFQAMLDEVAKRLK
jgi:hypothetical protein